MRKEDIIIKMMILNLTVKAVVAINSGTQYNLCLYAIVHCVAAAGWFHAVVSTSVVTIAMLVGVDDPSQ